MSADEILRYHQLFWDADIKVDQIGREVLKETAKLMPVKNSEKSQQGAGGI